MDEPFLSEWTRWVAESGDGKTGVPRPAGRPRALNTKAVWFAIALGADAVAIGTSAMMALNCNKAIPEANFEEEIGVPAGYCYHCHTGRCPVGITTQDPELRKRLRVDEAAERVYNFLHTLTLEAQMFARACGKTDVHSLEPEDLCALTVEASAMAKVPLAGTTYIPGQTEERALAEIKALLEKQIANDGVGGRNG